MRFISDEFANNEFFSGRYGYALKRLQIEKTQYFRINMKLLICGYVSVDYEEIGNGFKSKIFYMVVRYFIYGITAGKV